MSRSVKFSFLFPVLAGSEKREARLWTVYLQQVLVRTEVRAHNI